MPIENSIKAIRVIEDFFSSRPKTQPPSSQSSLSQRVKPEPPPTPSIHRAQAGPSMARAKSPKRPLTRVAAQKNNNDAPPTSPTHTVISLSSGSARSVICLSDSSGRPSPIRVLRPGESIDLTVSSGSESGRTGRLRSPTRLEKKGTPRAPSPEPESVIPPPRMTSPLTSPPASPEEARKITPRPERRSARESSHTPTRLTSAALEALSATTSSIPLSTSQRTLRPHTTSKASQTLAKPIHKRTSSRSKTPLRQGERMSKGPKSNHRGKRKRGGTDVDNEENCVDLVVVLPPPNVIPKPRLVDPSSGETTTAVSAQRTPSPASTISRLSSRPSKRARTTPIAEEASPLTHPLPSTPTPHGSPLKRAALSGVDADEDEELLPSSQKGEGGLELTFTSPSKSQDVKVKSPSKHDTWNGGWTEGGATDDWDMDTPANGSSHDAGAEPPRLEDAHLSRIRSEIFQPSSSLQSTRSMDEVDVSLALPILTSSPAPTAPSSAVPTPPSPARVQLTGSQRREERTKQIIAEIRARVSRTMAEEEEEQKAELDLREDSDELEDMEDVWKAAMTDKDRLKKSGSGLADMSPNIWPSSPLSTPPSSSPSPGPSGLDARATTPTPQPRRRPRMTPPTEPPKKGTTKSNRDLDCILKQADQRERDGITAAIRRAEEIVNRGSKSPSPGLNHSFSQGSVGSQDMDLLEGSSLSGGAILEHLGEDKEEMVKLFERDKAERREQQLREEHGGKGARLFWNRAASDDQTRAVEDWNVPAWKEDELMLAAVNAVSSSNAQRLNGILCWLPYSDLSDTGTFVEWLLRVATRHQDMAVAHTARAQFLNFISTYPEPHIPLGVILGICRDIGMTTEARASFDRPQPDSQSSPLGWNRDLSWILTTLVCGLARLRMFKDAELPDLFVLLFLIGMDPGTSPAVSRELTLALEDAVHKDAVDHALALNICKQIGNLVKSWTISQKSLLLSLFPRGRDRTMVMARWLAVDILIPDTLDALDESSYQQPPSLPTLLSLVNYQSRTSPFGIHAETNYEELYLVTQIMETALTHMHSYLQDRENHATLAELAEEVFSVYTKIMDTRAAHLERTEAKDALQRLSLRLRYSIPKSAPPMQTKLPFAFGAVASKSPSVIPQSTLLHVAPKKTKPRPRRLAA
ncbi:hypothetical protein DACRYDRAFT_114800 [Dacryopinax primogenitus]|uniref:Uncharacterized protein n=1 Tax=Dacryopinax primogenitus (strain DJM 731) TaxID=1858805 RepID=M5G2N2_DACPD|nr:uncharacterized protein DACRYDRAFT_114800 [Dacryopinax primogenitus]EJU04481.1 hypothetical protein DACRYDRAFT_114800 [Dacryopinax primogenitus]